MQSYDKLDLNDLKAFLAVAHCGSFTQAAEQMGVAKSRISQQIQRLESGLGVALFHRTTRRVRLTLSGESLIEECEPIMQGLADALVRAGEDGQGLTGPLRISAPVDFAVQFLTPVVKEFMALHPLLTIELRSSDHITDTVREGIDVAFRAGWLQDSSLRAVKLREVRQRVMASPAYLQQYGTPTSPDELVNHKWLMLTLLRSPLTWSFIGQQGEEKVLLRPHLKVDSAPLLRNMIKEGLGISVLEEMSAKKDIAEGTLVPLLDAWRLPSIGVYAVYPTGGLISPKARAFVAFCREALMAY